METELIEYLRRSGRKPNRDKDGNIKVKGNGIGRQKKGVLYCGAIDTDHVMIGFSLCSNMDKFDYVGGQHEPGFGLTLASNRALKWLNHTNYFVQKSWTEEDLEEGNELIYCVNPDPKTVVEIPPSMIKRLKKFIGRCRSYYKNMAFPVWVEKLEKDEPVIDLDEIILEVDENEVFIEA